MQCYYGENFGECNDQLLNWEVCGLEEMRELNGHYLSTRNGHHTYTYRDNTEPGFAGFE